MRRNMCLNPRSVGAAGVLALGLGLMVAGCGGGDNAAQDKTGGDAGTSTAYCAALTAARSDIVALSAGAPDLSRFAEVVEEMRGIAAVAPSEIAEEWSSIAKPETALADTLASAGIDLVTYVRAAASGTPPKGVTSEQMIAIGQKAAVLQDPKIKQTNDHLIADAKTRCGLELTQPSSQPSS